MPVIANVPTPPADAAGRALPVVIQGGMGVGVSSWRLARAVSRSGQLGVVSGTGLDNVLARRLQDGDPDGDLRRALAHFPVPGVAERILARHLRSPGRAAGQPYAPVRRISLRPNAAALELAVASSFAEVWLAKERHDGLVGINLLEKIRMATPPVVYGAMLAGVDVVLMGAGIPAEIPRLLDRLARHEEGRLPVRVEGAATDHSIGLDPVALFGDALPTLRRPAFLAIVSAHALAGYLARDRETRPDGFVIEGPNAGGHNAPPRGRLVLDEDAQPVYGPRDDADTAKVAALGLPFWLAGSYGTPERVAEALAAGAAGVQVGTLFALCTESGLADKLRHDALKRLEDGTLRVRTDALASPTGYPFKVASLPQTLSEPEVVADRPRLCDLGYLREPYQRADGTVGYRCPAEPVHTYVRKGGDAEATAGRRCLCNALMANIGLGQTRRDGYAEAPMVTLGTDTEGARRLLARSGAEWTAVDVVNWLLSAVPEGRT